MTDYKSIIESPFYEKANKYVEETGNNDCTLEAYIDGATEATKELEAQIEQLVHLHNEDVNTVKLLNEQIAELEAQIEKMKNCKNCANYMISGKCPSFFRTGWCKNWELTDD